MRKKIFIQIISLAIIITATLGFIRLRYFERSIWVFKTNNEQTFRGDRFERGESEHREFRSRQENFGEKERADFLKLPDSIQHSIIRERGFSNTNDSIATSGAGTFTGQQDGFRKKKTQRRKKRRPRF